MKDKSIISKIVITVIFAAALALAFVFYNELFGAASVFSTYDGTGILKILLKLVPAFVVSFLAIAGGYVGFWLFSLIVQLMFNKMSNKAKTVLTLTRSLVKWIIIIAVVIIVLQSFGVDMATLLAGLGILALIIGLGAQQIVADVLAGFFIVFEAEFSVGDIVTIDGWRGTVSDIGIRVTKLIDASGNIKIVNNSDIRSIVNLTAETSTAFVTVSIDYGEDLNKVELVIRDNLAAIKERIPAIIDGPYYKGVTELGSSSVDLMLVATCKETDIFQVKRDINREIFLLFNDYDINIPFPQVTVSQREEKEKDYKRKSTKKHIATAEEANTFVDEQADLAKDYEEKSK